MFHIKSHCHLQVHLIFSYVYFCALNISGKFYETHIVCDQIYLFFWPLHKCFSTIWWKDYVFFIGLPLLLSKRSAYYMCRSISGSLFCSIHLFMFYFFPVADCVHHCSLKSGSVNPPALNFLNIMMANMPFCFWYKVLNKCVDIQKLTFSDLDSHSNFYSENLVWFLEVKLTKVLLWLFNSKISLH